MRLTLLAAVPAVSLLAGPAGAQTPASPDAAPALERFNPDQADRSLDACSDFFQYACTKWVKANPIPPDQSGSGTFNKLAIWNVAALRSTLEDAAKASHPTPVEQRAGDYFAA